jgi:glycosyltransferase involved in cell wall biosynthesis
LLLEQRPDERSRLRISVALATYDGAEFLTEQLASIASQRLLPCELQIGDDGSSDATETIVATFARDAPFPVSFHRNAGQLGYGENFIQTAKRCSGDWIAFCDQDDVWLPEKLRICRQAIDDGPADLRLIVHAVQDVDHELTPIAQGKNVNEAGSFARMQLPPDWHCFGMTQVFAASLVHDIPSDRRPSFSWHKDRAAHDVWISLLANVTGTTRILPKVLALYRRHGQAQTFSADHARPESFKARLFQSANEGSLKRAEYIDGVASILKGSAADASPRYKDLILTALPWLASKSSLHRDRALIYSSPRPTVRLRSVLSLMRARAYGRSLRHMLGPMAFAKDVARIIIG